MPDSNGLGLRIPNKASHHFILSKKPIKQWVAVVKMRLCTLCDIGFEMNLGKISANYLRSKIMHTVTVPGADYFQRIGL